MSGSWELAGTAGPYSVWRRQDGKGGETFNVTYGDEPSPRAGGYPELGSLLRLKGLFPEDFVSCGNAPSR